MTATALPIEQAFATGSQGATVVIMVCAGWLWAGLYASPYSATPTEVSAAVGRSARITGRHLQIGAGRYLLSHKSLQSARRWLDRNGVRIRESHSKVTR